MRGDAKESRLERMPEVERAELERESVARQVFTEFPATQVTDDH
jgi:hypothetical protein